MKYGLFSAVLLGAAFSMSAADDLLVNPEFNGAEKGKPAGWQVYATGLPAPQLVTLKDGKPALLLADDTADRGSGYFQTITCEPGAKYELSCTALPVPGKNFGRPMLQMAGKNLMLRAGKNVLGVTIPANRPKAAIYVWTSKAATGNAYLRDLKLRKVDQFSPDTAIDGRWPKKAPAKTKPAVRNTLPAGSIRLPADGKKLTFHIPEAGIYQIDALVSSPRHPDRGSNVMFSFDGRPWTYGTVRNYQPMDRTRAFLQIQRFSAGKHTLEFNSYDRHLKDQVIVHEFHIIPYQEQPVPEAAKNYKPAITPPKTRPRILVTPETLPQVRRNLALEPNKSVWDRFKRIADKEISIPVTPGKALGYNGIVCQAIRAKFFAYLMTQDKSYALSGKKLLLDYLHRLDFVRAFFYVRWYGEIIRSTALAYDWAYDFFTPEERAFLRERMDFFAHVLEVRYPPFGQSITIGHGGEQQIHMDLMSMAVATYEEDPVLYNYCMYHLLQILVPERVREFESARHTEGSSYGQYRLSFDLYSAMNLKMLHGGKEVFHPNIKDVYYYWLYARMPNGSIFNTGDGYSGKVSANISAMATAYSGNPLFAGELVRAGGLTQAGTPEVMLAWYDPAIKPDFDLAKLPLTFYHRGILSSMHIRTGWNLGQITNDAVIEFNAKEFNLSSHSHRDTGSFQIFYRGFLAGDIGQYRLFGVPYDVGFGKRTVSHSALLVYNPAEKMPGGNDGGQKRGYLPLRAENFQLPERRFATTLAADFGPVADRPLYNVLKTDMTQSYPKGRLQKHIRSFYFLNFNDPEFPGTVIVADRVESQYTKYFQVNSPCTPEKIPGGVRLTGNAVQGMPGHLYIRMLRPRTEPQILSGKMATNVFGKQYHAPKPEIPAHRIMFPAANGESDYLCIMQITSGKQLPVASQIAGEACILRIRDWTLVLADKGGIITKPFTFEAAGKVLLADLAPGDWTIEGRGFVTVEKGKHTAFLELPEGTYTVKPGRSGKAIPVSKLQAILTPPIADSLLINGRIHPAIKPLRRNGKYYLPARAVAGAIGKKITILPGNKISPVPGITLDLTTLDGVLCMDTDQAGVILNVGVSADAETGNVSLDTTGKTFPVLQIASSNGKSVVGLFTGTGKWSHNSPDAGFTVRFFGLEGVKGLDMHVHSASLPMTIEGSTDGRNWQILDKRETNPVPGSITQVRFAKPLTLHFVRFKFAGSIVNPHWNALNKIEIVR